MQSGYRIDIPALTGFRFLSAFFVLLGHAYPVVRFGNTNVIGEWLGPLASTGMSMFFVLSGFLMWINYGVMFRDCPAGSVVKTFTIARFARLYPMLICLLLLSVASTAWSTLFGAMPGALLFPIMMNAWFPGHGNVPLTLTVWNAAHTWSISAEFFCYALFPIFALTFCRVRSKVAIIVAGTAMIAILMAISFIVPRHLPRMQIIFAPEMPVEQLHMWITYYSPITRIFEFGLGCVAASYFLSDNSACTPGNFVIGAGVFAIGAAIYLFTGATIAAVEPFRGVMIRGLLAIGSALLIYGMARHPDHSLSALFSTRPARLGGEISYSTYLLHPFILVGFVHPPTSFITPLGIVEWAYTMVAAMATIYFVSYAAYRFIEVPCRRRLRDTLTRTRSTTELAVSVPVV